MGPWTAALKKLLPCVAIRKINDKISEIQYFWKTTFHTIKSSFVIHYLKKSFGYATISGLWDRAMISDLNRVPKGVELWDGYSETIVIYNNSVQIYE